MIMCRLFGFILFALVTLGLVACDKSAGPSTTVQPTPPPQSRPVVKMTLAGRAFDIEVANDESSREIGLMYRDSMPAEHGMLFVFPDEIDRGFWMKNTRIPLDIIYLDHAGKIVSIRTMKPFDLTSVPSNGPAMYAIELNQGIAAALGLKPGDVIEIPSSVANSAR